MALSEHEKEVLQQMEDDLRRADPDLASTLSASSQKSPSTPSGGGRLDPRRVAAGSALAVCGLGVVLVGVTVGSSIWSVVVGVLGFAMMVGGVMLALHTDRSRGSSGRRRRPSGWSGFIAGQEDRWDHRDDS